MTYIKNLKHHDLHKNLKHRDLHKNLKHHKLHKFISKVQTGLRTSLFLA